jgi:hypothetical protein
MDNMDFISMYRIQFEAGGQGMVVRCVSKEK